MEELCLIWTVELSRVRYYLRDYLRVRLGKVEKYVMSLLDNPGAAGGMHAGGQGSAEVAVGGGAWPLAPLCKGGFGDQ